MFSGLVNGLEELAMQKYSHPSEIFTGFKIYIAYFYSSKGRIYFLLISMLRAYKHEINPAYQSDLGTIDYPG